MSRRTKEESQHTREMLLDAAESLFFAKGVTCTTLEEIAREAGVTRGAFYWHFKNKCELFNAIHDRVKLPMDALFDQYIATKGPLEGLQEICLYALKHLISNERQQRVFTITLFKCEQVETLRNEEGWHQKKFKETISRCEKAFAAAQKEKRLAAGITPHQAALALHAYMNGIFADYLRNRSSYDLKKHAPALVAVFFRGIQS